MHKIWSKALPTVVLVLLGLPATALASGPELSFSPDPVSFGKNTVSEESTAIAVEVQNVGDAGGSVESSALEGEDNAAFKIGGSDCGWIEAGQHCNVWVSFAPGSVGEKNASLVVRLKEGPEATVALSGTAVAPQLTYGPVSLDFGIQRVNENRSEGLQVTNSGEAAVRIGSSGVEGVDSGNFWTSSSDCYGGRRLDVGESCFMQVNFNPWQAKDYEATVTTYAAGIPFSAALSGTGGEAMLAPASNPVEFGSAAVGGEGSERTIVLSNEGNLAGAYFIAVIAGGDVGSFQLIDENCTGEAIAPGATCAATVRFDPIGVGPKIARLALFGESGGGTMVFLKGEGEPAASTGQGVATSTFPVVPQGSSLKQVRRIRPQRRRFRCPHARVCPRIRVFEARRVHSG
jgi:hypothetical protein